jgi:hypothetical protein
MRTFAGEFGLARNPAFVPTQFPGCVLWLRADKGITIGTGVSAWADQSGAGLVAAQATGSQQPTYNASDAGYNGAPTLSFDSLASQVLNISGFSESQPITAYVVGESAAMGAQNLFSDHVNNMTIFWGGVAGYAMFAGGVVAANASASTKNAICGVFNGASSAIYIGDSTAPVTGDAGTSGSIGPETIGSGPNGGLEGKLAEVIMYTTAHDAAHVSTVFKYLASRYSPAAWS